MPSAPSSGADGLGSSTCTAVQLLAVRGVLGLVSWLLDPQLPPWPIGSMLPTAWPADPMRRRCSTLGGEEGERGSTLWAARLDRALRRDWRCWRGGWRLQARGPEAGEGLPGEWQWPRGPELAMEVAVRVEGRWTAGSRVAVGWAGVRVAGGVGGGAPGAATVGATERTLGWRSWEVVECLSLALGLALGPPPASAPCCSERARLWFAVGGVTGADGMKVEALLGLRPELVDPSCRSCSPCL